MCVPRVWHVTVLRAPDALQYVLLLMKPMKVHAIANKHCFEPVKQLNVLVMEIVTLYVEQATSVDYPTVGSRNNQ